MTDTSTNETPTNPIREKVEDAAEALRDTEAEYSNGEERPLGGYVSAMASYAGYVAVLSTVGKVAGKSLPDRISASDFALMALGTHKLARIIAKDSITSPLRAPFTRYKEPAGASELNEEVRGTGRRHAIGELLECPFCLAVWVSTSFVAGHAFSPKKARAAATVMSLTALSDMLQFVYSGLKEKTT